LEPTLDKEIVGGPVAVHAGAAVDREPIMLASFGKHL